MTSVETYYDQEGIKAEPWDGLVDKYFTQAKSIREQYAKLPRWQVNAILMQESVKRFIDYGQDPAYRIKIDCTVYSEYVF